MTESVRVGKHYRLIRDAEAYRIKPLHEERAVSVYGLEWPTSRHAALAAFDYFERRAENPLARLRRSEEESHESLQS